MYNLIFCVSVDEAIAANNISDASFQIGASWQANKNFLLKVENLCNVKQIYIDYIWCI